MSSFNVGSGKSPEDSSRKIKVHQRFARANQSTNHLVDRGANGGLASADMKILQNADRKINIVGIDDHELTSLDVVTAAALFDTQKDHHCQFMLPDKWNGSTAKLMIDPRLLEVLRVSEYLMDTCFHFPLNLAWFAYIPSRFL